MLHVEYMDDPERTDHRIIVVNGVMDVESYVSNKSIGKRKHVSLLDEEVALQVEMAKISEVALHFYELTYYKDIDKDPLLILYVELRFSQEESPFTELIIQFQPQDLKTWNNPFSFDELTESIADYILAIEDEEFEFFHEKEVGIHHLENIIYYKNIDDSQTLGSYVDKARDLIHNAAGYSVNKLRSRVQDDRLITSVLSRLHFRV